MAAREVSGRPFVAHIHATEYDRAGEHGNAEIIRRERDGLTAADRIISNSHVLKRVCVERFGAVARRVDVVHWGIDGTVSATHEPPPVIRDLAGRRRPVVLFLGRVTWQKGPDYFIEVASRVSRYVPDARFVVPVRNPYETIPSLLKLMAVSWKIRKRSDEQVRESLAVLAEASFHNYLHPLEVLDAHPEVPRAVVDYRDLVTDPAGTVRRVYDEIGLDVTPELEAALAEQRGREHTSTHSYSLAEFGLEADEIRTRLAPLFERFGWEDARV